jgi:hypothetical protein
MVALLAGLMAAMTATVFDLAIAERFVARAVAVEAHGHAAVAVQEPFSRSGQRGGLVTGELLLGAGVAFLLAGAATFVAPCIPSAQRLWLLMTTAGIWAVVVLPAAVYPPLPPGIRSSLPIGERQLLYLAVVAVGIAGFGAAAQLWTAVHGLRRLLTPAAAIAPAALAFALLPDRGADTSRLSPGLLTDFRVVSVVGQLLFWATLAAAGAAIILRVARDRSDVASSEGDPSLERGRSPRRRRDRCRPP